MPSFADQIRKIAAKRMQDADTIFANVAFQAANSIIERTPVDEGTAKGSWVPVINGTSNELPNRTGAQATQEARNVANNLKLGDEFRIMSNLEYMVPLEYGYSDQAPNGMVRITADQIQTAVNEEVKNVR